MSEDQLTVIAEVTTVASLGVGVILMLLIVTLFSEKPRKLSDELQRQANIWMECV